MVIKLILKNCDNVNVILFSKLLVTALLLSVPFVASAAITFTSTADGKTLAIPAESFSSPAAKEFLNSGKNPLQYFVTCCVSPPST